MADNRWTRGQVVAIAVALGLVATQVGASARPMAKGIADRVFQLEADVMALQAQIGGLEASLTEQAVADAALGDRLTALEEVGADARLAALEATQSEQELRLGAAEAELDRIDLAQQEQAGTLLEITERLGDLPAMQFPVVGIGGTVGNARESDGGLTWTSTRPGVFEIQLEGREDEDSGCFYAQVHAEGAVEYDLGLFSDGDPVVGTDTYGWRLRLITTEYSTTTRERDVVLQVESRSNPFFAGAAVGTIDDGTVDVRQNVLDRSAGFLLVVRETPQTAACVDRF